MIKKVYHLSTCNTCKKIMAQVPGIEDFEQIDIKVSNITAADLDKIAAAHGGFEQVFSRRAMKFRSQGWHEKELTEQDYRRLILEEYTFLKRPVFLIGEDSYVGNTKKNVAALVERATKL
ncbi:MAG: ArsC/Spx/MgsR family protein [Bacteroidota bacterium]